MDAGEAERRRHRQAVRANENTAQALYDVADAGLRCSQEQARRSVEGTSGLERKALSAVPELTNLALDVGLNVFFSPLGTTVRALENAGGAMMDYRAQSGAAYDPRRAAEQGMLTLGGSAAGSVFARTADGFGTDFLYGRGLSGRTLPNAVKSGANAVAYTLGEVGGGELGRAVTEEDYAPDWQAIGARGASAFAVGFADQLLKSAADSRLSQRAQPFPTDPYASTANASTDRKPTPDMSPQEYADLLRELYVGKMQANQSGTESMMRSLIGTDVPAERDWTSILESDRIPSQDAYSLASKPTSIEMRLRAEEYRDIVGNYGIIAERVADGQYPLEYRHQKYLQHTQGTAQYENATQGRQAPQSFLTISEPKAQAIVFRYGGTGEAYITDSGKALSKEFVTVDRIVGQYYEKGAWHETRRAAIIYSKDGTHIVPVKEQ